MASTPYISLLSTIFIVVFSSFFFFIDVGFYEKEAKFSE